MEGSPLTINVKMLSKEVIKPIVPTLSHLKIFKLSYVDQITTPTHTCCLVLFDDISQAPDDVTTSLKTALSKTLAHFYPLAGRIKESTILCNDEGVPFLETRVDCSLHTFLNSPNKIELLPKFLPPRGSLGNLEKPYTNSGDGLIHLCYQINFFTCGGIVLGWYDIHKITDGTSATTFLKLWASIAAGRDEHIEPNLVAAVEAFPPLPEVKGLLPLGDATKDDVQSSPTVVKSFIFTYTAIKKLKGRAQSEQVPNPSRLQAVAGFIWERALHVSRLTSEEEEDTMMYITLDMRPCMEPPIPREAIGNLSTMAFAMSKKKAATHANLVEGIQQGISKMKNEISGYKGERAAEILGENWNKRIDTLSRHKGSVYKLVSWCNVGFNDVDFGFGKPKWVIPTDGNLSSIHKNLFVLNDYTDQSDGSLGIEAWLFLELKDMHILEANNDFLSFAKLHSH